jgi:hypothetical protein
MGMSEILSTVGLNPDQPLSFVNVAHAHALPKNYKCSAWKRHCNVTIISYALLYRQLDDDDDDTRWFKYDRDKLWLVYTQIIPVIFEPPCNNNNINNAL